MCSSFPSYVFIIIFGLLFLRSPMNTHHMIDHFLLHKFIWLVVIHSKLPILNQGSGLEMKHALNPCNNVSCMKMKGKFPLKIILMDLHCIFKLRKDVNNPGIKTCWGIILWCSWLIWVEFLIETMYLILNT